MPHRTCANFIRRLGIWGGRTVFCERRVETIRVRLGTAKLASLFFKATGFSAAFDDEQGLFNPESLWCWAPRTAVRRCSYRFVGCFYVVIETSLWHRAGRVPVIQVFSCMANRMPDCCVLRAAGLRVPPTDHTKPQHRHIHVGPHPTSRATRSKAIASHDTSAPHPLNPRSTWAQIGSTAAAGISSHVALVCDANNVSGHAPGPL